MPIDAALLERIKANDPKLIELDLRQQNLSDKDIQPLVEALAENTALLTLDLFGNHQIGDTGATAIAQALESNTTLQTLILGFNLIGATGATAIAQMLKDNKYLPPYPSLVHQ